MDATVAMTETELKRRWMEKVAELQAEVEHLRIELATVEALLKAVRAREKDRYGKLLTDLLQKAVWQGEFFDEFKAGTKEVLEKKLRELHGKTEE